ncbi:hypothetical protein J3R83DRAFT_4094 [Lanmaoa asiatica]|nr:hypothetical protein J3R83DRAFT_4094 [Lanmaoa asiatica]
MSHLCGMDALVYLQYAPWLLCQFTPWNSIARCTVLVLGSAFMQWLKHYVTSTV